MRVRAIGPLEVTVDGRVAPLTQPKRLALLAYLALARPRGMHSRDTLLALLWPESTTAQARQALRNSLYAVRRALGDNAIETAGQDLVGVNRRLVTCDVDDTDVAAKAETFDQFVELLDGFHVSDAPDFERWLDAIRAERRESMLRAAIAAADELHGSAGGTDDGALDLLRRVARIADGDPRLVRRIRDWTAPKTTPDPEAYVLYVRGTYLFLRAAHAGANADSLHESRDCFTRALDRDPGYALAIAGLSNYYAVCAARGLLRPFAETFGKTIELSRRALALDRGLAIPHVHFGVQAMYLESNWLVAEHEFSSAVALDPLYAEARRFLGILLLTTGRRADGLRELREAARAEPQIPMFRNSLGDALLSEGRYGEAIDELRVALRLEPGYRAGRERLIRCLERTGRYAAAIEERRQLGDPHADRFADALQHRGDDGYRAERAAELRASIAALRERVGLESISPGDLFTPPQLQLALAHAELGEWDEALSWETRAAAQRPGLRQWFIGRPELEPLARRRAGASGVAVALK